MDKYFELLTKWTDIKIHSIKKCIYCGDDFAFFDLEKKLLDKHWFSETVQCSTCMFKMLNSYLNDRHLYFRKDSESGENIISILSDNYKWNVLEAKKYTKSLFDDLWLKYWKNIWTDIISDFKKLYNDFPKPSRLIYPSLENADYSSHVWWAKNLYLSFCVFVDCEDIFYSLRTVWWTKNAFNSYNIIGWSNIYCSMVLWNCHNAYFVKNSVNSSNLIFCTDMNNCSECIFCCNQVNKKYMIFNKQYLKDDYFKIKDDILNRFKNYNEFKSLENNYYNFLDQNYISNSININNCEKVVWEATFYSKNSVNTFSCTALENSANVLSVWDEKNDININIINSVEAWTNCQNFIWSCSVWLNAYNIFYSLSVIESKNIYYWIDIEWCEELMFCVWLKNKKYCILNKQYEKDEYFKLKTEIINDLKNNNKWWDYQWFDISIFPYNDTLAYDYFKVNKIIFPDKTEKIINSESRWIVTILSNDFISDAILDLWWKEKIKIKWRTKDKEINIWDDSLIIQAKDLPNIDIVTDDILQKTIICEESWRPFRIIKKELDFLKNKWLPLPRIHHELRIDKLLAHRPIWQMFLWKSDLTWDDILSVYKYKPKYKVYSINEYNELMYN